MVPQTGEVFKRWTLILVETLPLDEKRRALGSMANELGKGGQLFVARLFVVSREFVRKGQREAKSKQADVPRTSGRGRKPITEKLHNLTKDIETILSPGSHADPRLADGRLYAGSSAREVREALAGRFGYTHAPSESCLRALMNRMGYKLRTVEKAKPLKRVEETDQIFENVHRADARAAAEPGTAVMSIDCKDKVRIGCFPRKGKSRVRVTALDHDYGWATLELFGIMDVQNGGMDFAFTSGKADSGFMADRIDEWLGRHDGITRLLVHADNGPQNSSNCRAFTRRLLELSAKHNIDMELAYYPPCMSKHNPIGHRWGVLEKHWNRTTLDTAEKALAMAASMSCKGLHPLVSLTEKTIHPEKIPERIMKIYETALDRTEGIEKWAVSINPQAARAALAEAEAAMANPPKRGRKKSCQTIANVA
jgi:hypothetical protein